MKTLQIIFGGALGILLLICSQVSFAELGSLDFSEENSDSTPLLDVSVDAPVVVVLSKYDPGDISAAMLGTTHDVLVADYARDSFQLIAEAPVAYRAYDLYRAHKVPWQSTYN